MKTSLLSGLNEEQKDEFRQQFASAAHVRQRIVELLKSKIDNSNKSLREKSNYEDPAWAFKQADGIGYERALYEVISLISSNSVDK